MVSFGVFFSRIELEKLLNSLRRESEEIIKNKKYEIERILEEIRYISEETFLQKNVLKKNIQKTQFLENELEKYEKEQTKYLIDLFRVKEKYLVESMKYNDLKKSFNGFYEGNNAIIQEIGQKQLFLKSKNIKKLKKENQFLENRLSNLKIQKEKNSKILESLNVGTKKAK